MRSAQATVSPITKLLANRSRFRGVVALIEISDDSGFKVVYRRHDLPLSRGSRIGDYLAQGGQVRRGPLRAFLRGVIREVAGVVPHRKGRRGNGGDHSADDDG